MGNTPSIHEEMTMIGTVDGHNLVTGRLGMYHLGGIALLTSHL
jgi:hypothetical protein